jgi:hypothetical protein
MFHAFKGGHDIEPLGNISKSFRDTFRDKMQTAVVF